MHFFDTAAYGRKPPLVLLNGLAEQEESWFANRAYWSRYFHVCQPNLLVYDGPVLQRRIAAGRPITVDYLVEQLHQYLEQFVQTPPYYFVASSLGGKLAVEYAVRFPAQVDRLVLLCPSGLGTAEKLPMMEGVQRSNPRTLIDSVFYDGTCVPVALVGYYRRQFSNRCWRLGLLRTIRGTKDCCVLEHLPHVLQPTLVVGGREDRIVDPRRLAEAARLIPGGRFLLVPRCGHAPQIERPRLINRLVTRFWQERTAALPVVRAAKEMPLFRRGTQVVEW